MARVGNWTWPASKHESCTDNPVPKHEFVRSNALCQSTIDCVCMGTPLLHDITSDKEAQRTFLYSRCPLAKTNNGCVKARQYRWA